MKVDVLDRGSGGEARLFTQIGNYRALDRYVAEMLDSEIADRCGVLVTGEKGTGKTSFVEDILQRYAPQHPLLIARHNQQHEKIPYFGFKYGISDYLSKIYSQFNKKDLHQFSRALKVHMGQTFPLLFDYIPELALIAGEEAGDSHGTVAGIENQVYPLFKRLFEFLAEYAGNRLVFFTDDLQWMDASGVSLLKYLLSNLAPQKMIWIGAYRSTNSDADSLLKLDEELGRDQKRIETVALKGLSITETRHVLEAMLGGPCDDELVESCFSLSGGNLSHLQFFVETLRCEGYIHQEKKVWMGDYPRIASRFSGEHSDSVFFAAIHRLSSEAQEMISVVATMGRFNRRILLDWFGGDAAKLDDLIREAQRAGLLSVDGGDVQFSDKHVGERIYNALGEDKRVAFHHRIGESFCRRGPEALTSTEFILMTSNFNHALAKLREEGRMRQAAELNFQAGKRSQQENALEQARHFFRISAELLRECSWEDVEDEILKVYMERARVEYELGEYDLAEIHLDYLLGRIADPVKRARIFELKITINNHLGRYIKVVRILEEALNDLGVRLPLEEGVLLEEVRKLSARLGGDEADETDNPPERFDVPRRQAILKLLYVGGMGLHHNSDVLMRWAALQIILCSGKETISGVKAIGCVSYGRMLIISGEIEKGYAFGLKGLQINDELKDLTLRCRVYGVYAFYIQPWKKPFRDSYRYLDRATEAGKKSGDLIGLYIIKTHRLNLHLVSGLPLHKLPPLDFEESNPGRELTYYITHYQQSLLDFLVGKSQVFTMPRQQPAWLAGELTIQEEKFYRNYVWARYYFLFGHYELAAAAAQEADNNRKLQEGSPLLPANLYTWFLSITQNWSNYDSQSRRRLRPVVDRILASFALWQEEGPANFQSMGYLLQAEAARIDNRFPEAAENYERSASSAGSNVYHQAVTHELWARFLLNLLGAQSRAAEHLAEAIKAFHAWGALAKVRQLVWQYQAIMSWEKMPAIGVDHEIDIETIQYELSGDMEVSSLVKKLMVLLLRVSGSTHVVVELVKDTGDRITVDELSLLERRRAGAVAGEVPLRSGFPVSLVMVAVKSHSTVVVNDLHAERGFRGLEFVRERGVKSFLILPVTINGHLSMVIYLENVFADNWYVAERVRWVRIAANQGAVIIENARTHERAVKLNHDLRREMAEKERLAALVEAQKDAHLRAVVQTQDHERKRIASDLHDSLGSLLSTVKLRFSALQEDFDPRVPEKICRFEETMRMLDDAIAEVRQISHNMLPVSLTRFGLKAAMENFVERINASSKLQADLQILGLDRRLPEELEVAAYRICQELVQNVIKHAEATHTSIQIIDHTDALNIIVEDDGKGMHQALVSEGFGFTTIRSKVSLFKGSFDIESRPGHGTMAVVDLPVVVVG